MPAAAQVDPLAPRLDARELFAVLHRPDAASVWDYLREGPFVSARAFADHLVAWTALAHVRAFALRTGDGALHGVAGLIARDVRGHAILPDGPHAELAFVVVDPHVHGTGFAASCIRQIIAHAFAEPGLRGCLWRCDIRNIASERFALKLGFTPHATLPDGEAKGAPRVSRFFHLPAPPFAAS